MTTEIKGRRGIPWRIIGWGGVAFILLLPLIANAPWTVSDYLFMGLMLGCAGLVLELAVRASGNIAYRAGVGVAVAASFLLVWVNGAVGFLGNEDNPANLIFFGVIAVAVVGSAFAGFRSAGMAFTMFTAAACQILIGLVALPAGWASPGGNGLYEVVMGTTVFASLWLISAALFRKAAGQQVAAVRPS
ncbi:hypothetical protein D1610_01765 [Sphingomonas gilva]|uniref:Uncharacterized protein n=1 Tax=Sphingomonas gilva TaxID=2305907 RepID=A0A396S659_9SPHN|nr:hypothetical protein [Sphingomonas gilva]RHW18895.1 hypothetical protein D1610_01765 [Sphingomonas gilva]